MFSKSRITDFCQNIHGRINTQKETRRKDAFGIIDCSPLPGDHDLKSKFTDITVSSQDNLKSNWGNLRPYPFDNILYTILKLSLRVKIYFDDLTEILKA